MNGAKSKVALVRHSPQLEQLIASAAKLCYASETETLLDQDGGSARDFVAMLRKLGHLSPIEHVSFTFYIEGVSHCVAEEMLELVKAVAPSVFEGTGPKCIRAGRCPEGKMSCGRYAEVAARYGDPAGG